MVNVRTTTYTTRGNKPLKLDIYEDDQFDGEENRRAIIYIHNGNFMGGHRSDKVHKLTCQHFAEHGFFAVAIDYRQGMKDVAFRPDTILKAIRVEDVLDATSYLVENAEQLRVDPGQIVLSGSGAGGCIALTTEYEMCNGRRGHLPDDFNYGCIASNSGALATDERALNWGKTPCPMLIVQGEGVGDIPTGYFYVPGLLWIGGDALHNELNKAESRNIYIDTTGTEHRMNEGGRSDSEGVTSFIDSMLIGNIEMFLKK